MSKPMKSRLRDLYLLAPRGWPSGYHPTACYYCGRIIARAEVGRCDATGYPVLEMGPTGEWFTVTGNMLAGARANCARFKGKEPRPHVPVALEKCGSCDGWRPPEGTETVDLGRHAAYEKQLEARVRHEIGPSA